MLRRLASIALVMSACDTSRTVRKDAALADAVIDSAPPPRPTVDAGPPPMEACGGDAGTCMLPPSTCLDSNYLVYYTGGTCAAGMCELATNLLYCPSGCVNGGCAGGFT